MTKEQFLKDRKLADKWREQAHEGTFQRVLTYARAHIAELGPTREELRGVELMAHTLLTLADAEEASFDWPLSGLDHQAEQMPQKPKKENKT